LDFWLYYVDELPVASVTAQIQDVVIESYSSLNMRVGWYPVRDVELSLTGFNLLDQGHTEMIGEYSAGVTEVERSIFAKIRWNF
ncbi:MAG: TonB-dependent receptor, partial [Gammaproteobacteria bacterium]|nr:TonB-dependent receptor [Gammaproteobacteria bacterium]